MDRYIYTKEQRVTSSLKKTIYPNFNGNNYFYVDANSMNRIDNIANKYYKDPSLYWFVILSNNLPTDSLLIKEKMKLKIFNNIAEELSKMRD